MTHVAKLNTALTTTAGTLTPFVWVFVWMAIGLLMPLSVADNQTVVTLSAAASSGLFALAIIVVAIDRLSLGRQFMTASLMARTFARDTTPVLHCANDGTILQVNKSVVQTFGDVTGHSMATMLGMLVSEPVSLVLRLQRKARFQGAAHEFIDSEKGQRRLSVHSMNGAGYLWRMGTPVAVKEKSAEAGEAISLPMLTANAGGKILHMNAALLALTGPQVTHIDRLFTDLPLRHNGVHHLHGRNLQLVVHVAEIVQPSGRRDIYLSPFGETDIAESNPADILDGLPVALIKLSADGHVMMANRMARHLLGHSMNSRIHFNQLVKGLGRSVDSWLQEGLQGKSQNKPEVVQASKSHAEVYLQVNLHRIVENGDVRLIAVLNDATELKTLEAQFVQSQKMQAIGQLAGGVAHDFNNLLTAISGYCDLLLLRHDEGDPDYGDLLQISQNANRAASLVGQLLAFSRKQSLQPEVLDLRDTLSDISHLLNRLLGEQVSLSVENAPSLAVIRADKRQLEQVIVNLVVNARDAMPDGGVVRIETENLTLLQDLHRDRAVVPKGDYVSVKVADKGAGIAPDDLQKIFEPFFTTKGVGEGTGLGLSTAYGIVKQSGGFIFVDSTLAVGTEFTLLLPVSNRPIEGTVPVPAPATLPTPFRGGGGVVLLVEDEAPVRTFAARALRMRGFTVLEAPNAEDALAQLQDTSLAVDVFVTDVVMPGLDGPTWVRQALKQRPHVKVVFVSGYAEDAFSEHQDKIPNSVFLPKPFSLNELTNKVNEQFH